MNREEMKQLRDKINQYTRNFIDALFEGDVPAPEAWDC